MATHTASRLMRSIPQRYGMNQSWYQSLVQSQRHYYTGDRYQGYISFFSDELFGFVVREDLPDKEYYFHSTDLHARNVPRVRPLQQCEFSIVEGRGGHYIARDITGPNSGELEFNHANMRIPQPERTQLLSSLPNGLHDRHKGVVVTLHADGSGGLVVPDRLNFNVCSFRMSEIQATGFEKIDRFSEVEFFVRPARFEGARDRAVCITRPGGGLITGERKDMGSRRRQLGAMYGPNDTKARVPPEFTQNRQRGIVVQYDQEKLFGFIASLDNPSSDSLFVHIDDCHIGGKRLLRKDQLVEYVAVSDETSGRSKALHVTGANVSVLRNISGNHYLPQDLTTLDYEADGVTRHVGSIIARDQTPGTAKWFVIKPNDRGYKALIGFRNDLQTLGYKKIDIGAQVEFSVDEIIPSEKDVEKNEGKEQTTSFKAVNVTAEGGTPLLTQGGKYGKYLQARMKLPLQQRELTAPPLSEDNVVNGYIANFNRLSGFGSIEIEAPDGERYQKVQLNIDDCILSDDIPKDKAMINAGLVIKCNVVAKGEPTEEEQEIMDRGGFILERRATNITSIDLDFLQSRAFVENFNDEQPRQTGRQTGRENTQNKGPTSTMGDDDDMVENERKISV